MKQVVAFREMKEEDFAVEEKYRGQGYGTGILEYLEKMLQG